MAKLEKTQLDEKQYIANEMIACTFLLGLVNDGRDKNTKLGAYLQQTMEITSTTDGNDTIKKLKARGGRDQLLMFLTGPAGSEKSTAMKVAQQFCYEFCIAVGIMWSDKAFIYHIHRIGSITVWWCNNFQGCVSQSTKTTQCRRQK